MKNQQKWQGSSNQEQQLSQNLDEMQRVKNISQIDTFDSPPGCTDQQPNMSCDSPTDPQYTGNQSRIEHMNINQLDSENNDIYHAENFIGGDGQSQNNIVGNDENQHQTNAINYEAAISLNSELNEKDINGREQHVQGFQAVGLGNFNERRVMSFKRNKNNYTNKGHGAGGMGQVIKSNQMVSGSETVAQHFQNALVEKNQIIEPKDPNFKNKIEMQSGHQDIINSESRNSELEMINQLQGLSQNANSYQAQMPYGQATTMHMSKRLLKGKNLQQQQVQAIPDSGSDSLIPIFENSNSKSSKNLKITAGGTQLHNSAQKENTGTLLNLQRNGISDQLPQAMPELASAAGQSRSNSQGIQKFGVGRIRSLNTHKMTVNVTGSTNGSASGNQNQLGGIQIPQVYQQHTRQTLGSNNMSTKDDDSSPFPQNKYKKFANDLDSNDEKHMGSQQLTRTKSNAGGYLNQQYQQNNQSPVKVNPFSNNSGNIIHTQNNFDQRLETQHSNTSLRDFTSQNNNKIKFQNNLNDSQGSYQLPRAVKQNLDQNSGRMVQNFQNNNSQDGNRNSNFSQNQFSNPVQVLQDDYNQNVMQQQPRINVANQNIQIYDNNASQNHDLYDQNSQSPQQLPSNFFPNSNRDPSKFLNIKKGGNLRQNALRNNFQNQQSVRPDLTLAQNSSEQILPQMPQNQKQTLPFSQAYLDQAQSTSTFQNQNLSAPWHNQPSSQTPDIQVPKGPQQMRPWDSGLPVSRTANGAQMPSGNLSSQHNYPQQTSSPLVDNQSTLFASSSIGLQSGINVQINDNGQGYLDQQMQNINQDNLDMHNRPRIGGAGATGDTLSMHKGAAPAVIIGSNTRARSLVQNLQAQQKQVSEQEQVNWTNQQQRVNNCFNQQSDGIENLDDMQIPQNQELPIQNSRKAQIIANLDRDKQNINDKHYFMEQERLARVNNIQQQNNEDLDLLAEKKDRLSNTVKQTRGVKLQSIGMSGGGPSQPPVLQNKYNINGAYNMQAQQNTQSTLSNNANQSNTNAGVMPLQQIQILQEHDQQPLQRPNRPRTSRQRPSSSLPSRKQPPNRIGIGYPTVVGAASGNNLRQNQQLDTSGRRQLKFDQSGFTGLSKRGIQNQQLNLDNSLNHGSPSKRNQFYDETNLQDDSCLPRTIPGARNIDIGQNNNCLDGSQGPGGRIRKRLIDAQLRSSVDLKKHDTLKNRVNQLSSKHLAQNFVDDEFNLNDRLEEDDDELTDTNNDSRMAKYSNQNTFSNGNVPGGAGGSSSNQQTPFGLQEKMILGQDDDGINLSNEPSIQQNGPNNTLIYKPGNAANISGITVLQTSSPPTVQMNPLNNTATNILPNVIKINPSFKKVTISKDQIKLFNPKQKQQYQPVQENLTSQDLNIGVDSSSYDLNGINVSNKNFSSNQDSATQPQFTSAGPKDKTFTVAKAITKAPQPAPMKIKLGQIQFSDNFIQQSKGGMGSASVIKNQSDGSPMKIVLTEPKSGQAIKKDQDANFHLETQFTETSQHHQSSNQAPKIRIKTDLAPNQ